jgi:hypothetical protein
MSIDIANTIRSFQPSSLPRNLILVVGDAYPVSAGGCLDRCFKVIVSCWCRAPRTWFSPFSPHGGFQQALHSAVTIWKLDALAAKSLIRIHAGLQKSISPVEETLNVFSQMASSDTENHYSQGSVYLAGVAEISMPAEGSSDPDLVIARRT